MKYIRWLNAFSKRLEKSQFELIKHELENPNEVAAEIIRHKDSSKLMSPGRCVGLLIDKAHVVRRFKTDVNSVHINGRLNPTSRCPSSYGEAFVRVRNGCLAIVIVSRLRRTNKRVWRNVVQASEQFNLPIITVNNLKI